MPSPNPICLLISNYTVTPDILSPPNQYHFWEKLSRKHCSIASEALSDFWQLVRMIIKTEIFHKM